MAKKTKGDYTYKHNSVPNALSHREATRKAGTCQLCGTKEDLKSQFTVVNDLDEGTVIKKKNAARKGAEKMSHYCGDCATRRVKQKQAWLDSRDSESKPKPKAKPAKAKKASGKKSSGKKKAPARRKVTTAAAKGSKEVDPF